jgi:hypothetical protein
MDMNRFILFFQMYIYIYIYEKAMDDIDYVVANTIAQCSVFVTGIWGWLLYEELNSKSWGVVSFFISSALLVGGACIVAYYGTTM